MNNLYFIEEVEFGVKGLRARFWTDFSGDWWLRFVQMAKQKDGTNKYEYASVPILVLDYLYAPTEWVMATGEYGGKILVMISSK